MKLHVERKDIERSNVGVETQFRIKTSAHAFDILSSGLYTDNILAIVRELSSNAYDAHVAAGKDSQPFEIHLPSNFEPWFHVKDFGVGLSDEEIQGELVPVLEEDSNGELVQVEVDGVPQHTRSGGLYTTYFDSTKTDSNDFIGALGLGSKSPFSYTNAFEVISRHNGKRRIYSIFLNEDGLPTITKMGEIDTDESNGVEVKLTVKRDDFYKFKNKTASALRWFPVKPKIIGDAHFQFESTPTAKMSGDSWMFTDGRGLSSVKITAIQGNVAYTVNSSQLNIGDGLKQVLSKGHLYVFFEIGELEVAASREEIRYDARSVKALEQRLTSFYNKVLKDIEKKADQWTESNWHAIVELDKLSSSLFGKPDGLRKFLSLTNPQHPVLKMYHETNGKIKFPKHPGYKVYIYNKGSSYATNLSRTEIKDEVHPTEDLAVFINDLKTGGVARLNSFITASNVFRRSLVIVREKDAIQLKQISKGALTPVPVTEKEYEDSLNAIINCLGNPGIKVISRDTPSVQRSTGDRSLPIYTLVGVEDSRSNGWRTVRTPLRLVWDRVNHKIFDIEKGGMYFDLRHRSKIIAIVDGVEKPSPWETRRTMDRLNTAVRLINEHYKHLCIECNTFADVYGVGSTARKKLEKMDNWFNIFDLLIPLIPLYTDVATFNRSFSATVDTLEIKKFVQDSEEFNRRVLKLDPTSTFRQKVQPLIEQHKKHETSNVVATFMVELDKRLNENRAYKNAGEAFFTDNDFKEYTMLQYVSRFPLGGAAMEDFFDYIETIDRRNK